MLLTETEYLDYLDDPFMLNYVRHRPNNIISADSLRPYLEGHYPFPKYKALTLPFHESHVATHFFEILRYQFKYKIGLFETFNLIFSQPIHFLLFKKREFQSLIALLSFQTTRLFTF